MPRLWDVLCVIFVVFIINRKSAIKSIRKSFEIFFLRIRFDI